MTEAEMREILKEARLNQSLTQKDLSAMTHIAQGSLSEYERGSMHPSFDKLVLIATALGLKFELVPIDE